MLLSKRFVYILKSLADPNQYYIGVTSDPSLDFVAFSAVGFNRDKTKALVYVETRSSFQTHLMERQGDRWEASKEGVQCGAIA